jgi:hypothetical protein
MVVIASNRVSLGKSNPLKTSGECSLVPRCESMNGTAGGKPAKLVKEMADEQ